jgi:ubiquinone/menaquinone biosynthesis C-methylase UbiE
VRRRLRALLPRLHILSALNERAGDTVVSIRPRESVSELADRVAPDGDLLVVDESVDELERFRRETAAPNVFYLIGSVEVLPLMDSSVDEVLTSGVLANGAAECFRVLRPGGKLGVTAVHEDPAVRALNLDLREIEQLFTRTGFASVSVAADPGRVVILAQKP